MTFKVSNMRHMNYYNIRSNNNYNNEYPKIYEFNPNLSYFENLKISIRNDSNKKNLTKNIINPLSGFYLADHYYGNAPFIENTYFYEPKGNNLLDLNNISKIKDYDIIHVQGGREFNYMSRNFYAEFVDNVLPKIDKKIILITTSMQYFFFNVDDSYSKRILENDNVILWFLTNICLNDENLKKDINHKMRPFPYGMLFHNIENYVKVLLLENIPKTITCNHLHLGPNHHTREIFPKKPNLDSYRFYYEMKISKFILSPTGDRPDCYRHWEAIGLDCIPISNISEIGFKELLGDNMLFVKPGDDKDLPPPSSDELHILKNDLHVRKMLYFLNNQHELENKYHITNKDLICVEFWKNYVTNEINKIKIEN